MPTRTGRMGRGALCVALVVVSGCKNDQGFVERPLEAIAVATGDFDSVEFSLDRLLISYQTYEGYISEPTYDLDSDPDSMLLKVETLFGGTTDDGGLELDEYDAVFVNSGMRGVGEFVYNGVEPDSDLVSDETVVENLKAWVDAGGILYASDWAYDLVEAAFPDAIEFYGDDTVLDAAQAGSAGSVDAVVIDTGLRELLGNDTVSLAYNYSYWAVIESVGSDTTTWMSGDVEYRISASEGYAELSGAPLLVSFEHGGGQVVYSTFHANAQTARMVDSTIDAMIPGLPTASSETEDPTVSEAR